MDGYPNICLFITVSLVTFAAGGKDNSRHLKRESAELWGTGYVRLPQLITDVGALRKACTESAKRMHIACKTRCTEPEKDDPRNEMCRSCDQTVETPLATPKSFLKARNIHRRYSVVKHLAESQHLATVASELLSVTGVRLYSTTAFVKEVGDVESSWHQDSAAAPLDTDKFLTIWIALEDISVDSGPLLFAEGSHLRNAALSLRNIPLEARVAGVKHMTDDDLAEHYVVTNASKMRAGDATAHLGWTMHKAAANTGRLRRDACTLKLPSFLHLFFLTSINPYSRW